MANNDEHRTDSKLWVDGLTIGDVLRETARRWPEHDAYVFHQLGSRATWGQFDRQVDDAARALLATATGFRGLPHCHV